MLLWWLALLNILTTVVAGVTYDHGTCSVPETSFGRKKDYHSITIPLEEQTKRETCARESGADAPEPITLKQIESQYIVRFHSYLHAEEHHRALVEALGSEGLTWKWIERRNRAAAFPTDFGLISIGSSFYQSLKARLGELSFVKDLHLDKQILRVLSAYEDGTLGEEPRFGAFHGVREDDHTVRKLAGRLQTRPTFGFNSEGQDQVSSSIFMPEQHRSLLFLGSHSLTGVLEANKLWEQGYTGQRVKIGVFDTGVKKNHPHIRNIRDRTNWTDEDTLSDGMGHGSFVAGVIASSFEECLGVAPDVELYTFRVFTNKQVSYTSWFLDAFNYAIISGMQVVNLSVGGPDYLDEPFVDKVLEITANGILMISAIGNDGPYYGTLNNPADQNDVIGVGGINYNDQIAGFSSRGLSNEELPLGYGRIKPDVVAYAQNVKGSKIDIGCRELSGTSVASPVVAGAVCLLASTVPEERRWQVLNPASMKQALVWGATRLEHHHIYEQGAGKLNLEKSMEFLRNIEPHASLLPAELDLTDCPYMWPFCAQPLYAHAMPVMINTTILNSMGVIGHLEGPPEFEPYDMGGRLLEFHFENSDVLWPWSGYLAMYIHVKDEGEHYQGLASGSISFKVVSPAPRGELQKLVSTVQVPFMAEVIPTPPRERRLLWDMFHSIKYPPEYLPSDNLEIKNDLLDWNGDHPHSNFHLAFNYLVQHGYYVEVLASPFTCFDASQYGALLLVDPEEEYYPEEIQKLSKDVQDMGLGLVVFADWYNVESLHKMKFFDDNTRNWWLPATGGANIPALNRLLDSFGVAFGDTVLSGTCGFAQNERIRYASGTNIVKFPESGYIHSFRLEDKSGGRTHGSRMFDILGLTSVGKGRVVAFGDSNCLDSTHQMAGNNCHRMLKGLLEYVTGRVDVTDSSEYLSTLLDPNAQLERALGQGGIELPTQFKEFNFTEASFVLQNPLMCYKNSLRWTKEQEEEQEEEVDDRPLPSSWAETLWQDRPIEQVAAGSNGTPSAQSLMLFTTWVFILGIIIAVGWYRFTRRKKSASSSSQGESSNGGGEHVL